jgi:predicted DNA-binding protein
MVRRCVVKVVLSKEQREILTELSSRLGTSESEAMRMALMDYVKELSLMAETLHRSKKKEWRKREELAGITPPLLRYLPSLI